LKISYSAVQDWRRCQQLYAYRYIDNLESVLPQPAMTLGTVLHNYLEGFYRLYPTVGHADAHANAVQHIEDEHGRELIALGNTAYAGGQAELAEELFGLVEKAQGIAERYYTTWGQHDADTQTPLLVEEPIEVPLTDTILTPTRVDLVTRDDDGLTWLWEHKSSGSIPPQTRRMKDLQTTLMAAIIHHQLGIKVDGVVWNYLRTKPPTVPDTLKSGLLTMRKDLDSTWPTYLSEIERLGQDPIMYDEVRQRLEGRELTNYFVRIAQPLYQREDILLRDFVTTAQEIEASRARSDFIPVRNVSINCDWCSFSKLCEAAIISGDESDLKTRLFKARKERPNGDSSTQSTPTGDDWGLWDDPDPSDSPA